MIRTDRSAMPWGTLSVLSVALFVAITTEVLPVGLLPTLAAGLGTSEARVGLLVSAYAVVVALGSVPLTALLGRWSRRQSLVALLLIYAAGNALFAVSGDYAVALVARLITGFAHAGFFSLVFTAAAAVAPPDRSGRAVAVVNAGIVLGLAVGVPAGTQLGTTLGWRWAFALLGALLAVLAICVGRVLRDAPTGPATDARGVLGAVTRRPLLFVAIGIVVVTLGHYTVYTYIDRLALDAGVATGRISELLFGYGAAAVIGLVIAHAVVDRSPRAALLADVALLSACLAALALSPSSTTATVLGIVIWGAGFGALPTLAQEVALRSASHAPEAAPAVVNATFNVGIAGGAAIGGAELGHLTPAGLAATGVVLALLALVVFVLPARDHVSRA